MQTAMKLAEDDKAEIADTQANIARIEQQIAAAEAKEVETKEEIEATHEAIAELDTQLNKKSCFEYWLEPCERDFG